MVILTTDLNIAMIPENVNAFDLADKLGVTVKQLPGIGFGEYFCEITGAKDKVLEYFILLNLEHHRSLFHS